MREDERKRTKRIERNKILVLLGALLFTIALGVDYDISYNLFFYRIGYGSVLAACFTLFLGFRFLTANTDSATEASREEGEPCDQPPEQTGPGWGLCSTVAVVTLILLLPLCGGLWMIFMMLRPADF